MTDAMQSANLQKRELSISGIPHASVKRRAGNTGRQMYGMRRPVLPGGTDDRRDGKRLSSA